MRAGGILSCDMIVGDGAEGLKSVAYQIQMDSPPTMVLASKNYSDLIAIDTAGHSFVMITRLMSEGIIGSKVCRGMFLTGMEAEHLSKQQP